MNEQEQEYSVYPTNDPDPEDQFVPVEMSIEEARERLNALFMQEEE